MKKGFTLIELLAVIVILAIISLIAIPALTNIVDNARLKADIESVRGYINAAENYYMKAQYNSDLYDTLGSNVIDKLDVKGTKLDGSIVVTLDGKVEAAIIKNNKCYKKSALSNDIDILEKNACTSDNSKYVSNNGKLHINGSKILNSNNKEIVLKGFCVGTSTRIKTDWPKWYTDQTFKTIRSWGVNIIRFTFKPEQYVTNPEYVDLLLDYIDIASKNDLYVLITWMGNSDFINYKNEAKEFFEKISKKYKNSNNIIYEIANEPFNNSWDNIYNYASEIISVIRANSNDSIIAVPTNYHISDTDGYLDDIVNKPLNYKNILYTTHMYVADNLNSHVFHGIDNILNNNLPIMISEWGTTKSDGTRGFYKENSDLWLSFIDSRKLSWINFNLSDVYWNNTPYDSSVVKMGEWNSKLPDSILSESGQYMKNYFLNSSSKTTLKYMMMNRINNYAFYKDEYQNQVKKIVFKTNDFKVDTDLKWDASMIKNQTIMAYLKDGILYISSKGNKLIAPSNMKDFFNGFTSLEEVDFENLNTDDVTNMSNLFRNCTKLTKINFRNINLSKLTNASMMFGTCTSLINIDLSNLNLSNLENINMMFSWASKIKTIKLPYLNESKIISKKDVFYKTSIQTTDGKVFTDSKNINFISDLISNSTSPNITIGN